MSIAVCTDTAGLHWNRRLAWCHPQAFRAPSRAHTGHMGFPFFTDTVVQSCAHRTGQRRQWIGVGWGSKLNISVHNRSPPTGEWNFACHIFGMHQPEHANEPTFSASECQAPTNPTSQTSLRQTMGRTYCRVRGRCGSRF